MASIVALAIITAMRKLLLTACTAFIWFTCAPPLDAQGNQDIAQALAATRAEATAGDVVAQFSLGSFLYYGATNTSEAVDWFKKAAAHGYAPAEFQMGQLYDFGFGVEQDDTQALAWYRKSAEHGSAAGQ